MTWSRRVVAPPPPVGAACSGAAGALTGALVGVGGVLLAAPGTPLGTAGAVAPDSETCWLRTAAGASPWFGPKVCEVDSVCEKSTSAVTVARRFSRPTSGSSSSTMRRR